MLEMACKEKVREAMELVRRIDPLASCKVSCGMWMSEGVVREEVKWMVTWGRGAHWHASGERDSLEEALREALEGCCGTGEGKVEGGEVEEEV